MANPANRFQLLILAATAADAESLLATLKRGQLPVRGAFSMNPKSLLRAHHVDLILACIDATVSAREITASYAEIERRIPLIVIAPPGEHDADALHLLRAGAHGLLTPGDEDALFRAVRREWKLWTATQQVKALNERLKRSERHLQALLKAGGEGGQSGQRLDPQAAIRSLIGVEPNGDTPRGGLMDLLSPEYREALGPLLTDRPQGANPADAPPGSSPDVAQHQPEQSPADANAPEDRPPADKPAEPSLDLTLKPSGEQLPLATKPDKQQAKDQPLALEPSSEEPALPAGGAKSLELPPLALATSEEPLPDLSEKPQALSGQPLSDDELIAQIERALENDGFKLAYQPIISLRGDSQERYSVLLRLLDDNRAYLAADDLLEPAARSGRMPEVDRWVIQHALGELSERRQAGHRAHFLLSLSNALLQDPELLLWICDQLRQHSVRGNWVSFQIQEQDVKTLGDAVHALASGLRQVKSPVVIGSFGRNPDSELLFDEFPLDFVRLSPAMTENLTTDQLKRGHVKHLLAAAQSRHIKTIAGCIEDERTLAAIWRAGADYVQGKVLGRPSSVFDLND